MVGQQAVVAFVVVLALVDLAVNGKLSRSQRVGWALVCLVFYRDWRTGWGLVDGLPVGAMGYLLLAPGAAGRRAVTSLAHAAGEWIRARRERDPSASRPHLPVLHRRSADG